jgi:hypothetical protein
MIEAQMPMIIVTAVSRHSAYFSVISTNVPLVVGSESECARRVVEGLIVLDAELEIASCGRALETHSIVVQVPEIDIQSRSITSVPMSGVMLSAGLPRITAVRR